MSKIEFLGWNGNSEGYNVEDYFTHEIPAEFASDAEAKAWVEANYKGADAEGVAPIFEVV